MGWLWLLTLGIVHTGLMYVLLYGAIQKLPTSRTRALSFIYPIVALLVDFIAFGQRLGLVQSIGLGTILLAAAGSTLGRKGISAGRRRRAQPTPIMDPFAHPAVASMDLRRFGARLVKTLYDPLGALQELTVGDAPPLAFERDGLGRERRRSASGFHIDQAWDAAGQLVRQTGSGDFISPLQFERLAA